MRAAERGLCYEAGITASCSTTARSRSGRPLLAAAAEVRQWGCKAQVHAGVRRLRLVLARPSERWQGGGPRS